MVSVLILSLIFFSKFISTSELKLFCFNFEEKNFITKNNTDFINLKKDLILNWILNKKKIIVKLNRRKKIIF